MGETMRRHEFITLVGGALATWPLTALGKAQRIAFVLPSQPVTVDCRVERRAVLASGF
jgi:hypothetical protein